MVDSVSAGSAQQPSVVETFRQQEKRNEQLREQAHEQLLQQEKVQQAEREKLQSTNERIGSNVNLRA